jgi:hypothetical protein
MFKFSPVHRQVVPVPLVKLALDFDEPGNA